MTLPSILKTTAFYALVAIIMVISVFPFYYAILTSLKSGSALFQVNYWPRDFSLTNYSLVPSFTWLDTQWEAKPFEVFSNTPPHRLAGATLLFPVTNSWRFSFPDSLTWELWNKQSKTERFVMLLTHNTPWLLYWWNNQKLFQTSAVMQSSSTIFSPQDVFTAQTR